MITATALIASIGNAVNFDNGRQLSAWLGLVPRQHSSGGKDKLLGISKRGDIYLRTLLMLKERLEDTQSLASSNSSCKFITSMVSNESINVKPSPNQF